MKKITETATYIQPEKQYRKYFKFIEDKFLNIPFGRLVFDEINDSVVKIYLRFGGELKPIYLIELFEFFDNEGIIHVPLSGEYLYYHLELPQSFFDKLDIELDANKYNL